MSTALDRALAPVAHILTAPETEDLAFQEPGVGWWLHHGAWHRIEVPAMTYTRLHGLAVMAAAQTRQEITHRNPILDCDLPGELRLLAVMPPAVRPNTMALVFRRGEAEIDELSAVPALFGTTRWNKWDARHERRRQRDNALLERLDAGDLEGFLRGLAETRQTGLFVAATGAGKAQPLDAKVLTPTGWRNMGDLTIGSLVLCPDGRTAPVIGIYPQGQKNVYCVTFADGRTVRCCDDHLWKVWNWSGTCEKGADWKVLSLSEVRSWFSKGLTKAARAAIPLVEPLALELPPENLPIPPYALGALLGDGHFRHTISISSSDAHILARVLADLPDYTATRRNKYDYDLRMKNRTAFIQASIKTASKEATAGFLRADSGAILLAHEGCVKTISQWALDYGVSSKKVYSRIARWGWPVDRALGIVKQQIQLYAFSPLPVALRALGLEKARSQNKFIPEIYKRGSVAQRLALIQGLLDTDGSVAGGGLKQGSGSRSGGTGATFTTTSERLAKDVQEISWSLGAIAKITPRQTYYGYKNVRKAGKPSWRVSIVHPDISSLFSLPRKVEQIRKKNIRHRLKITSIDLVGREAAQCIKIDHPDHLYVTDNYIVTHNTRLSKALAGAIPLHERIVTIEDAAEMKIRQPNHVRLFYATSGSGVSQAALLKATLRMRPDRIMLAEIRDQEAALLFLAKITAGHPGSMTTLHGRSAEEGARRLFNLLSEGRGAESESIKDQLCSAVDFIIPLENDGGVRDICEVWFRPDAERRGETFRNLLNEGK